MKKQIIFFLFVAICGSASSQIPQGFYKLENSQEDSIKIYQTIVALSDSTLVYYDNSTQDVYFFLAKYYLHSSGEIQINPIPITHLNPIVRYGKCEVGTKKNGSIAPVVLGNDTDGYHDLRGIKVYKNGKHLFSYGSTEEIHFSNMDPTNYSFSCIGINNFLGYEYNFELKNFLGTGEQYFIETQIPFPILLCGMKSHYISNYEQILRGNRLEYKDETIVINAFTETEKKFVKY